MAHPTAVILIVGLNHDLIAHAPNLKAWANKRAMRRIQPALPAVTCSVQSSMLTGTTPGQHGIVGNGWFNRELSEVQFWKQSNHLVHGEKVWETARKRDQSVTCANLFWWYNMASSVDFSVTPRPIYKADGRKLPDIHTFPGDLRAMLQDKLGTFPLFNFWGPAASIKSSQWIADAAIAVHQHCNPTLNLVYLPHLDYALQKFGPNHPSIAREVVAVDRVAHRLIDYFESRNVRPMIVSEYGIEQVQHPVYINRTLREHGGIAWRDEDGLEMLDVTACSAFAVADHQIAHVYVKDPAQISKWAQVCSTIDGVAHVLDRAQQREMAIDHARSGELVLIAKKGCWFTYDWWHEDSKAPDYARTVDIHRKPGYDPRELFIDPAITMPKLRIAAKLLKRKLGFRTLLDVIPLDASLVRGSHGRIDLPEAQQPLLITSKDRAPDDEMVRDTQIRDVILDHMFGD